MEVHKQNLIAQILNNTPLDNTKLTLLEINNNVEFHRTHRKR